MRYLLVLFFSLALLHAEKTSSVSSLRSELSAIAPGKPFTVALVLEHPDAWHSYYRNSGGVEQPPRIEWTLPAGSKVGEIQWPTPEVKEGFAGKSYVYSGSPIFLIEITPPASISPSETFVVEAKAKWQICKTSCIGESADFRLELPVAKSPSKDPASADLFEVARRMIPKNSAQLAKISATSLKEAPDSILLQIPKMEAAPTEFIPNQDYIKALSDGGKVSTNEDGYLLTLQRKKTDFLDEPIKQGNLVSGILVAGSSFQVPETHVAAPAEEAVTFAALLPILGGMWIGGLILNLMPCVFPVIGLKIMGFVQQAGENRRSIALHGITFALGVFASFAVLSGVLFAVRAAALQNGTELKNWGYQLQNPWIVFVLLILMFGLALNMFGLFEIGVSATSAGGKLQSKSGHSGSFFSGILATVVATPCSAPFLGAAIGAAIGLPAMQFFCAFAAMALGLSTPYLVLSFLPQLVEKLPRPGAWMESFKQAMSFLLFGTAAYLFWLYSAFLGVDNTLNAMLGLCLIAAAAWIYGRWNLMHKTRKIRAISLSISTIFAIAGLAMAMPREAQKLWQAWSQETVDKLVEEEKPIYIDFTAQWCLTCQVNKKVAYTDAVLALAKKKGIVFLKADKTAANPAIEAKLQELGRSAIPVNVLLILGKEPIITPEILTPKILTELFEQVP
jgi:thiol:disulfide interchange protein